MSYDLTGKLYRIFDTQQVKETFKKREFVVEQQDGQYPNYIKFELVQDRCGLIDGYEEGQEITVSFDLRGREWNDKYFTNLHAWRLQQAGGGGGDAQQGGGYQTNQGGGQAPQQQPATQPAAAPGFSTDGASNDDLPF